MKRSGLWLPVAALLVTGIASAETMYVTDQLTIGLRADVTPDAAILKTVSTGAPLEVIERNGSLVKVREPEGVEGWLEATALSAQPPAAQQLKTVRSELERTRAQLITAQTQLDKVRSAPAASPEMDKLRADLAKARSQLAETQAELKKREEEIAAAAAAPAPTPAPAVVPAATVVAEPPPETAPEAEFSFLWLGIAFAMLLVGFVGGIVWVKESIRRRMGGLYLRI